MTQPLVTARSEEGYVYVTGRVKMTVDEAKDFLHRLSEMIGKATPIRRCFECGEPEEPTLLVDLPNRRGLGYYTLCSNGHLVRSKIEKGG